MVQNTAKRANFHVFSLGDLTFSFTAQFENRLIIYDELPFIKYNIGYCGVSRSTRGIIDRIPKSCVSFNGDVMVIVHCFAAYDFLRRRRQI